MGDSAPLFYYAPQLQSLVALDPTAFYLKDRKLFDTYVNVVSGQDPDPARTIRETFGARWVTIPPALYPQLLARISTPPGRRRSMGMRIIWWWISGSGERRELDTLTGAPAASRVHAG